MRCARHSGTETDLTCGRCGTAVCPRCLVHVEVGIRCPRCAPQPRRNILAIALGWLVLLPLWRAIFKPKIIQRILSGVTAVVWVLVILAAIGAIVGGGGGTNAGTTPQVASQSAQPGATSQPASVQTQIGNLLFTVNGVSPYSDPIIPAEPGTHYVAVDLSIKNAGDETGLNSFDFGVKDSAGFIDSSSTTTGPKPLLGLVSIVAGQDIRGFIVFKIADGRDPVELQYAGGAIPLLTPTP
jgi:hypothetical protein